VRYVTPDEAFDDIADAALRRGADAS